MKAQTANAVLGLWLMAAPAVLDYGDPAAASDRIAGPIIASFATIAMWEATRGAGRANVVLGVWLIAAPIVLRYPSDALLNSISVGLLVTTLALIPGKTRPRFGGGWSVLWRRTHGARRGPREASPSKENQRWPKPSQKS